MNWVTQSEINNYGFEIEKSPDGNHFTKTGFVDGAGNANSVHEYEFKDFNMHSTVLYYRLKQIDFNGAFDYSEIIKITRKNEHLPLLIYPNPANMSFCYWLVVNGDERKLNL